MDESDPALLAEAVQRLADDATLRTELGARALAQAAEFDLDAVAARFKAVLQALQTPSPEAAQ